MKLHDGMKLIFDPEHSIRKSTRLPKLHDERTVVALEDGDFNLIDHKGDIRNTSMRHSNRHSSYYCPKEHDYIDAAVEVVKAEQEGAVPEAVTWTDGDIARWRKERPVSTGVLHYFPDAILEVAYCSFKGNQQHHGDKPLHWDKSKSMDEPDALARHLLRAGELDSDGVRESAKIAWRALAMLQRELDAAREDHTYPDYSEQPREDAWY